MRLNEYNNLMIFFIVVLTAGVCFADFNKTQQLTSNNIIALAGSGDTLWLATERGFNYQAPLHKDSVWRGFEDSELGGKLAGFEFGGGGAAAFLFKYGVSDSIGFWHFAHASGKQQQKYFKITGGEDDYSDTITGSMAYAYGSFWAAFGGGGLLKYNPGNNTVLAVRPGDSTEVSPNELNPLSAGDSAKIVKEIGVIPNASGGDSLIWIATPDTSTVWTYDPVNRAWDKIDRKPADRIYAAIDSTEKANGFRRYLTEADSNSYPEINCILFLPNADDDGAGTLVIAATTGLYVCRQAKPLTGEYGNFYSVKYVRPIKSGESYALPGILRGSADGRYDKCVFVYTLKKDGKVTIKVYDYNMSLVKTVVNGESRKKGSDGARSTNPLSDFWDGTNQGGKRVWPGVYYYKITSTGGDRLFGKIVLAK